MYNFDAARYTSSQEQLYEELYKRKNLMVYDGIRDGLGDNIRTKYFYSNPHEPLEFVVLDLYIEPVLVRFNENEAEVFGVINIVKEKGTYEDSEIETIYGHLTAKDIMIRDVDKSEITLYINKNGINDLKSAVLYFEKYFCIKGII
jgi:hypothetical protein